MNALEKYKAKKHLLTKLAINLKLLRAIQPTTVIPKLMRHMEKVPGIRGGIASASGGKIWAKGDTSRVIKDIGKLKATNPEIMEAVRFVKPLQGDLPKTPAGKEFLNRAVLSHEGSELGKHFGKHDFASHRSTRPFFHDMNMAASGTGPGSAEYKKLIMKMRAPEIKDMNKYIPGLERLNLGTNRISRHALKKFQNMYDRRMAPAHARHAGNVGHSGQQLRDNLGYRKEVAKYNRMKAEMKRLIERDRAATEAANRALKHRKW